MGWNVNAAPDSNNNLVTSGDFSATTGWTAGAGWAIDTTAGVANATSASSALSQALAAKVGSFYTITYTVTAWTAGTVAWSFGGLGGIARGAAGTYTETIRATTTDPFALVATGATLSVDNVSVKELDSITFTTAPAAGTNNIVVNEIATASFNATPVFAMGAWCAAYGYPGEVEFYNGRLAFASSTAQPQSLWVSRVDDYAMFGKSTPITDDDAFTITLNARELNQITDLFPVQHLLALTTGGVWKVAGSDAGVLTPSTVNAKAQPSVGAASLRALAAGETALYLTRQGGQVRDLAYTFEADGYAGSDLTAFAGHLLEDRTLVDWAWAEVPHSAAVAVGSDGVMLSMTYKREHQVVAWARIDTAGVIEAVCTIPEGDETGVYMIVRRTINGVSTRFVEKFAPYRVDDLRAAIGLDAALAYDGRNSAATTVTLAGGTTAADPVTVTMSAGTGWGPGGAGFGATSPGDQVVLDYNGAPLKLTISSVTSATVATAYASRPLTAADRVATSAWGYAVDTVSGLTHLEGMVVGIAADGQDRGTATVTGGKVAVSPPGVLVQVGLPYTCEFESLDMNVANGEPVGGRRKLIRNVDVLVKDTRALEVGGSFDAMRTLKSRSTEPMTQAVPARSEWLRFEVPTQWQKNPRVCIRNTSPLPQTILAISPDVEFGQ